MVSLNQATSQLLIDRHEGLSSQSVGRFYKNNPNSPGNYDPIWRNRLMQECRAAFTHLAESVAVNHPEFFIHYIAWAKAIQMRVGLPAESFLDLIKAEEEICLEALPAQSAQIVEGYFRLALQEYEAMDNWVNESHLEKEAPLFGVARDYMAALIDGDRNMAEQLIREQFERSNNITCIYLNVLQPVEREIGRLWHLGEVSVAQEHFATSTTLGIMCEFYPQFAANKRNEHLVVAACVGDELHDIGLRMVTDMFENAGWKTYFLGANTPVESIVQAVIERKANLLVISATLTNHISLVVNLIQAIRAEPACKDVRILVGGHPFNIAPGLWQDVGADGFGYNAVEAVAEAEKLFSKFNNQIQLS